MRSAVKSLRAPSAFALLVLALGLAIAGCGEHPRLAPLPSDAVVLAVGDSLTHGTGAAEEESYPAQLERLIGRRVVQAGLPGEVTSQALKRLPQLLDEHSPRLVLLCTGGNDFLRRLGRAQAEANVRAMVALLRSRGIEVLLIGTPEPGIAVAAPAFFGAIAEEFRLPYEADVIAEVLSDARLKSDPIHPNALGYRLIAERVAERLKQSGAI
jgi:lysophospholipase L1-like esterase